VEGSPGDHAGVPAGARVTLVPMSSMPSRRPSDGTFSRSVAAAGGRGIALIVAAVLVGALLLHETKDSGGSGTGSVVASGTPTSAVATATTAAAVTPTSAAAGANPAVAPPAPPAGPGAATRPLSEVRVLVVNGKSGIRGVAKDMADKITAAGYTSVLTPTDGPAHSQSTIYFAEGFDTDCDRLGAFVAQQRQEQLARTPITETLKAEVPDAANADCVVVIGKPAAGTTPSSAA
jgi:hypothetical protein